ncbi:Alanine racemase [Trichinella pseudospiralis]
MIRLRSIIGPFSKEQATVMVEIKISPVVEHTEENVTGISRDCSFIFISSEDVLTKRGDHWTETVKQRGKRRMKLP